MAESKRTEKPKLPTKGFYSPLYDPDSLPVRKINDADVLILHEGLIEELVSRKFYPPGGEINFLKYVPRIVRTSGKGRDARKLDARLPFCEYSAISGVFSPYMKETYINTVRSRAERVRIDKIMLAKTALNALGQTKPKNG